MRPAIGETLAASDARASEPGDRPARACRARTSIWRRVCLRNAGCRSASGSRSAASKSKSSVSLGSFADVPPVVRGLIAPDLPVVIYCPSENLWWLRAVPATAAARRQIDSRFLRECTDP